MKNRLKEIRTYFHLSQREFASKINISQSSLAMFELGSRKLKEIHINRIISEFPINEHWLRTGEGNMLNSLFQKEQLNFDTTDTTIEDDKFIKNFVNAYIQLNNNDKKVVIEFFKKVFQ